MAHRSLLLVALAVLATAAVAAASFADSNPIRPVTERAASTLESTILGALGSTRHALRFARFAVRLPPPSPIPDPTLQSPSPLTVPDDIPETNSIRLCRYGKTYESAAEVQRRFRIFSESLQEVRSTNRRGLSYKLGINRTLPTPF
jgi:cathepsin H